MPSSEPPVHLRLRLATIGALGGLSFWLLLDVLPDLLQSVRVILWMSAFAGALFTGLLLMVGPMRLRRAVPFVLVSSLLASMLLLWASFRFVNAQDFLGRAHPMTAYFVLVLLPLPFVLAHETSSRGWRDYDVLFDQAWSVFVRNTTAWAFVGLFWLVLWLSDALLNLVGFDYLGAAMGKTWFSMPLTGVVLGLALAVLHESTTVVATLRRLALALLRLLLPLVAIVVALFIVLVPFQGLGKVFGSVSAASTMLAMLFGAITLVTSSIDARDNHAARSALMITAGRGLSVLLPIIAGIAVYAIWVRVAQYGWTPARLAGASAIVIMLIYAIGYAVSVISGRDWRAHIRATNTGVSLLVIAVSALWLTPLLNAERISANSHVNRFISGNIPVDGLDVWALGQDWGKAGTAALDLLRELKDPPQQLDLHQKIAAFDAGKSRWEFAHADQKQHPEHDIAALSDILPVTPENDLLRQAAIAALPDWVLRDILVGCQKSLPDGAPACALIFGVLNETHQKPAAIFFSRRLAGSGTEISILIWPKGASGYQTSSAVHPSGDSLQDIPADVLIPKVMDAAFTFVPAKLRALEIDGLQITAAQ